MLRKNVDFQLLFARTNNARATRLSVGYKKPISAYMAAKREIVVQQVITPGNRMMLKVLILRPRHTFNQSFLVFGFVIKMLI